MKENTEINNELKNFWNILNDFFQDEKLLDDWINTNIPALGGLKPIELIKNKNGRKKIIYCIEIMKFGDFS